MLLPHFSFGVTLFNYQGLNRCFFSFLRSGNENNIALFAIFGFSDLNTCDEMPNLYIA